MTCKELYLKEHPNASLDELGLPVDCPDEFGYLDCPSWHVGGCDDEDCTECWNREIPEDTLRELFKKEEGSENIIDKVNEVGNPNVMTLEDLKDAMPKILDSGTRREFETGAVRDIQEGKGRCDLMPLDVVAMSRGSILHRISEYQDTGDFTCLLNALQGFIDKYYNQDMSTAFLEVSKHFEEGAKKYGESNWQKGIPTHCYIDSAVRHYLKYLRGDKDEPHDRAFVWNILCCIWTCIHKPELNDYAKKED